MLQPYEGEPENRGILLLDSEELYEQGRQAIDSGLSLAVHAIGDRANHEVLNAFDQLRRYESEHRRSKLRHRIEHVQLIHPDDVDRLAGLGIVASMQPIHATSDMYMADRYWGDRSAYAYAWRKQLDAGALLAFGSDAPVESPNPFWGLHAAVTRRRADGSPGADGWYPDQKLNMYEALAGFTKGPAYLAGMEDRLGRLSPGYLADLLVLPLNPFQCHPDEIKDIQPLATMVGGQWTFNELEV
jgi:predicted amidohydrolase YtcJ